MQDGDDTLGPGMDLVISLFSMSLILIMILTWLYFDSTSVFANNEKSERKLDTTKPPDLVTGINQREAELAELKRHIKTLNEEIHKMSLRNDWLTERLSDNKGVSKQNQNLRVELNKLTQQYAVLNSAYEQVATLKEGHSNEKIPIRSSKGKKIFRVYVDGIPSKPKYSFKSIGGTSKVSAQYLDILQRLEEAKQEHGSRLFVSVDVDDRFPYGFFKALTCDFWRFDYYEYSECDD